ncbi:hypothetical protein EPN87_03605 [archaeon]|nr:MAG: hypothetical protein EPN87_03605 [archaeon]
MELFSERMGITPKQPIQLDYIDNDLKNRLWNALHECYLKEGGDLNDYSRSDAKFHQIVTTLWNEFFKEPLNVVEKNSSARNYELIMDRFYGLDWYRIYDILDYIAAMFPKVKFVETCNAILEEENSGYRFVADKLAPITDKMEITEIEDAIDSSPGPIKTHINKAVEFLSKKPKPDYPNSIKESISAVESICTIIAKKDKALLSDALHEIDKHIEIHPSLKIAFEKIYAYTNNEGGIRHALIEQNDKVGAEDARYLLTSCSAFINYLIVKCSKAKIDLKI